jgi:hypothetical protein
VVIATPSAVAMTVLWVVAVLTLLIGTLRFLRPSNDRPLAPRPLDSDPTTDEPVAALTSVPVSRPTT